MKILILTKPNFSPAVEINDYLWEKGHDVYVTVEALDWGCYDNNFDLGISIHYTRILKQEDINKFKFGVINIHPSILPYGKGADPIAWGIINNEPLGLTIHYIDEGIDTGNLLYQQEFFRDSGETAEGFYNAILGHYETEFIRFWEWFYEYYRKFKYFPDGIPQKKNSIKPHKRKELPWLS